jgi:adenosylcobinamide-GDP ribazoletransferase
MNGELPLPDDLKRPSRIAPWMGFLAALQFLTILPPLVRRSLTARELGAAVGWFPFIGLLLGLALALGDALLGLFLPLPAMSALLLVLWVVLTGALHLDGFLDSCDGLFGGWTPEKRLEILRDERVGAYALAGGVLLLLVKFSALLSLSPRREVLILAPIFGRWCMSLAVVAFPYARPDGLGRRMKDNAGWLGAALASAISFGAAWIVGRQAGLATMGIAILVTLVVARFAMKRIPGLTGDIYGAINEIVEVVVLLSWVVMQRLAIG